MQGGVVAGRVQGDAMPAAFDLFLFKARRSCAASKRWLTATSNLLTASDTRLS